MRAMTRFGGASLLLVLLLLPARALGGPPAPGDDTLRARLKACLLAGDMTCVVDQYLLLEDLGRVPDWLVAFQGAFAVTNRKAGECEKVARLVHEGLTRLGQRPQWVRFTVTGPRTVLGFDEFSNRALIRTHQLSTTGHHVDTQLEGKLIDAYTGPAGLPFAEYLSRLHVAPGSRLLHEVIQKP